MTQPPQQTYTEIVPGQLIGHLDHAHTDARIAAEVCLASRRGGKTAALRDAIARHAQKVAAETKGNASQIESDIHRLLEDSPIVTDQGEAVVLSDMLENFATELREALDEPYVPEPKQKHVGPVYVTHVRITRKKYEARLSTGQERVYRRWDALVREIGVSEAQAPELFGTLAHNTGTWVKVEGANYV